jgi:hypothetical protein
MSFFNGLELEKFFLKIGLTEKPGRLGGKIGL